MMAGSSGHPSSETGPENLGVPGYKNRAPSDPTPLGNVFNQSSAVESMVHAHAHTYI